MKALNKSFVKKLIFISLTIILLSTSISVAWFAITNQVSQDGIDLAVDVTPNLIISTSSDLSSITVESASPFAVRFSDTNAHQFVPCSHYVWDEDLNKFSYLPSLKYVTNTGEIDQNTGLTSYYSYETVPTNVSESENIFYVDYVVYVASIAKALTGKITAQITDKHFYDTSSVDYPSADTLQAASIDFLVDGTLKGTLNVAGYDITKNDYTTKKTSLEIFDGTIPLNSTKTSIKITMRCYFDGALLKSAGQAYINTTMAQKFKTVIGVLFTAEESSN